MGSTRRYVLDPRIDPAETEFLRTHLDAGGWEPTVGAWHQLSRGGRADDWDLNWSNAVHGLDVFASLDDSRMVNHFPGIGPLHYKDELAYFLAQSGHAFHPTTFSMPWQYDDFLAAQAADPDALWLRKQKRWMAGAGMAILTDDLPIPRDEQWLVQRYVANPLLLPGHPYKHVLRRYVVITSLDPLTAHVHDNGPVKFTSRPFSLTPDALRDRVVHLTNPAVQRLNTDVDDPVRGIDQHDYRAWLAKVGIDHDRLFRRIDAMLADTLVALREPVLALSREWTPRLDRCFELLGFDMMVDDALDPWLLECNISPALGVRGRPGSPHHDAQRRAKEPMVRDMLRLVGLLDGPHAFQPLIGLTDR